MRYGIWAPIPQQVGGTLKWGYGRNGRRITAVVIHRMEGTLDGSDSYLRRERADYYPYPRLNASTHFGVGAWGWANRAIHRYQIRQWVDTAHSAFGWAARPTDRPTPLAYRTLGTDLLSYRADLNWQVISVEVEGFARNPWPAGLASKVKELLAAIARSHGPLVVMAHTDCSVKVCPGMSTFQAAMPGYYGRRLTSTPVPAPQPLPDTALPKELDLAILEKLEIPGDTGRLFDVRAGIVLRKGPGITYGQHFKTTGPVRYRLLGFSPGGWVAASNPNSPTGIFFVPPVH